MREFDLLHVGFKGIGDDGFHRCEIHLGFSDQETDQRSEVMVELYIPLDLDSSLEQLREQVRAAALVRLQEAVKLLERHSTSELHQAAQDVSSRQEEARQRRAGVQIARDLGFDS